MPQLWIKKQAKGDAKKEARLAAAACAVVQCWQEFSPGTEAYENAAADAAWGNSPALKAEREQVENAQKNGLFVYAPGDFAADRAKRAVNSAVQFADEAAKLIMGILGNGPNRIPETPPDIPNDQLPPTGSAGAVVTPPILSCLPDGCVLSAGGVLPVNVYASTGSGSRPSSSTSGDESLPNSSDSAPNSNWGDTGTRLPGNSGISSIADLTPVSTAASGGINATKISTNSYVLIDLTPAEQSMAKQVATQGDQAGNLTERLVESVGQRQGLTSLDGGKYGSNNGFDHVFQNPDGTVTILLDSKQFTKGSTSVSVGAGGQMQLTDAWVQNVLLNLEKSTPAYAAVNSALKNGTLVKGVAGVDRVTGTLAIVRVK